MHAALSGSESHVTDLNALVLRLEHRVADLVSRLDAQKAQLDQDKAVIKSQTDRLQKAEWRNDEGRRLGPSVDRHLGGGDEPLGLLDLSLDLVVVR